MSFTILIRNCIKKIYSKEVSIFNTNINKDKKFLMNFPNPKDNYERSYFQYKCQIKHLSYLTRLLQNIAAIILFLPYYINLSYHNKENYSIRKDKCAVFITDGISIDTIPNSLKSEYDEIIVAKIADEMILNKSGKRILYRLIRIYWKHPYFVFKCMLKIAMYSAKIEKMQPKAIISYSEYSFTSSILTEFCRENGIQHINIMHGEKLFNIRDSFVQYDKYYVWDKYYIDLLNKMRIDIKQFIIESPPSLKLNWRFKGIYKFTYYLADENGEELQRIKDALLRLNVKDHEICIRYHPRYAKTKEIESIFSNFNIENPNNVSIEESFSNTEIVISLYSTVLYQALKSGKKIIIDNFSNIYKYNKLKELGYILINEDHDRLSNLIVN